MNHKLLVLDLIMQSADFLILLTVSLSMMAGGVSISQQALGCPGRGACTPAGLAQEAWRPHALRTGV